MLGLAKLIFGGREDASTERDKIVDFAIEKALDVSDPRLRAISGYQRKLRPSARVAVDFVLDAVGRFPPALDVTPDRFGTDPQVRAFFGSAGQMREVFSENREIRSFLSEPKHGSLTHFYAGMRMTLTEKRVLANRMRGDTVQRHALRTAMNFGAHRIVLPNADEKSLREDLQERVFVRLIELALEQIGSSLERKGELKELRAALKTKLSALRSMGAGLEPLSGDTGETEGGISEIERRLADVDREISRTEVGGKTLEDHLGVLEHVLGHPEEFIRLESRIARVTRGGFKAEPGASDQGDEIAYLSFIADVGEIAAALVRFPRDALLPEKNIANARVL